MRVSNFLFAEPFKCTLFVIFDVIMTYSSCVGGEVMKKKPFKVIFSDFEINFLLFDFFIVELFDHCRFSVHVKIYFSDAIAD